MGKSVLWLAALLLISAALLSSAQQQKTNASDSMQSANSLGRQIFASNCADCHGLDGTGNQRAPNIVTNAQVEKLSHEELVQVVSDGVAGTGMPAFRRLGAKAIEAVTDYLRLMQGKNGPARLPGDPKRGEAIFFGKGECSNCHMAAGRGGFIASDLTSYGGMHTADEIRTAITDAGNRDSAAGMVTAIANNGRHYQGVVRNEDNFFLQLQSMDGAFYFLSKADLKSIERAPRPIMPADYTSRLNEIEVNDVISYLLSLGKAAPQPASHKDDDD